MALTNFRQAFSLRNLIFKHASGQIATFMMLIIVVILIFILVTVNLGQVSNTATQVANAADAAALALGSQLVSRAVYFRDTMAHTVNGDFSEPPATNKPTLCRTDSVWDLIGASLAILIVLALMFIPGVNVFVAANLWVLPAAGLVGGALGGGLQSNSWSGAISGGMNGAMMGAAVAGGMSLVPGGVVAAVPAHAAIESSAVGLYTTGSATIIPATVAYATTGGIFAGIGAGALHLSAAEISKPNFASIFAAAAKALTGLPEYDQIRQSIFFQGLTRIVDDPNEVVDTGDINGNGDTTEKIPAIFQRWNDRMLAYKNYLLPQLQFLIEGYITDTLIPLKNDIKAWTYGDVGLNSGFLFKRDSNNLLYLPGPLVRFLGVLSQKYNRNVPFYRIDPRQSDDMDMMYVKLHTFVSLIDKIETQRNENIWVLVNEWWTWTRQFYGLRELLEGNSTHTFRGLKQWRDDIELLRRRLPYVCEWAEENGNPVWNKIAFLPCRDGVIGQGDGCIDEHPFTHDIPLFEYDQFLIVENMLDAIKGRIEYWLGRTDELLNNIDQAYRDSGINLNNVTYSWHDSRCPGSADCHTVNIEVSPFHMASISSWQGGWPTTKYCLGVDSFSDPGGASTWVKVTRTDPAAKNMGILGVWNPYYNYVDADGNKYLRVSRTSKVEYGLYQLQTFNPYVKIVGRSAE